MTDNSKTRVRQRKMFWYKTYHFMNLTLSTTGNSYCVRLPYQEIKKTDIEMGDRVKPFIFMTNSNNDGPRKVREISLPITNIKKIGNSITIIIPSQSIKKRGVDVGDSFDIDLIKRVKVFPDEMSVGKIKVWNGKDIIDVDKKEWLQFNDWKYKEDEKYKAFLSGNKCITVTPETCSTIDEIKERYGLSSDDDVVKQMIYQLKMHRIKLFE